MLAQGGKTQAPRFQANDQRLQHGRGPRFLARPNAQVGNQDVTRFDLLKRLLQQDMHEPAALSDSFERLCELIEA